MLKLVDLLQAIVTYIVNDGFPMHGLKLSSVCAWVSNFISSSLWCLTAELTAEATTPTQVSSNHAHTKIATSSQGTTRPREIPTRPRASTTPIRTTATRPTTTEPGNKARDWFIHRPSFNDSSRGSGNGTVYTKAERELTKRNALLYQLVIGSLSVVAIVQGTCLVITRCNKRGEDLVLCVSYSAGVHVRKYTCEMSELAYF